jgi:hypothetical protein
MIMLTTVLFFFLSSMSICSSLHPLKSGFGRSFKPLKAGFGPVQKGTTYENAIV